MPKGYDPKCFELAEYFLGLASHDLKCELAQWIQDQIELWIEGRRDGIAAKASPKVIQ